MFNIPFILIAAIATIFNVYMWYHEIKNKKIFQFIVDLGGTLVIVIIFSSASETVSGFAISMIVSALWSIIAMIENKKRARLVERKKRMKMLGLKEDK